MKQIKRTKVTMQDGTSAILSTVEIFPGEYETMLLAPDGDEIAQRRTTSERQAIADFNHLRRQYDCKPLSGRYATLAADLRAAAESALAAAAKVDDGGTCNFDAVSVTLRGWCSDKVEQAAKAAGVGFFIWNLYGNKSFVFPLRCGHQSNARTQAAEAMCDALRAAEYDASMYYAMD